MTKILETGGEKCLKILNQRVGQAPVLFARLKAGPSLDAVNHQFG
jgi:hypothetical protein